MNILVFNPAAKHGGAQSILIKFIQDISRDHNNNYTIVISDGNKDLENEIKHENVTFVFLKGSYSKRLKWLYFDIYKVLKNRGIDAVISLENTCNIFLRGIPQYIYLHQSLQFAPRSVLTKKQHFKYKLLNGQLIKYSCARAKGVIVQTKWMSDALVKQYNIERSKIYIIPPKPSQSNTDKVDNNIINSVLKEKSAGKYIGLSVTGASNYKRIETLIEFVAKNNTKNNSLKLCMLLTISENQNEYSKMIYSLAKELDVLDSVIFLGQINRATLNELYNVSDALFFSSAVESLGLPLIEAMEKEIRIFAPALPYVRDVCGEYAFLYQFDNSNSLTELFGEFKYYVQRKEKKYKGQSFMKLIQLIRK